MKTRHFVLIAGLILAFAACSEVKDMKWRRAVLSQLLSTNATQEAVLKAIPSQWIEYDKDSEKGRAFGNSLLRMTSADMSEAKSAWTICDRAFYHTSESVVTLVFIKTNVIIDYYVGVQ